MISKEKEQKSNIINEMMEYFKNNKYDPDNKEMKIKLRNWMENIIKLEAEDMGYKTKVIIEDEKNKIDIDKILEQENNGELFLIFSIHQKSSGFISRIDKKNISRGFSIIIDESETDECFRKFNENSTDGCMVMMQTVLHELRHMRQYLMARTGVSSYSGLMFAKEYMLINQDNKFYKKNHNTMFSEEDAFLESANDISEMSNEGRYGMTIMASLYKIGLSKIEREDFAFYRFEKFINKEENRYYLDIFPVLKKEYNQDGSKKTALELVNNMKSEIQEILKINDLTDDEKNILIADCKEMYFEILYRQMRKTTQKDINDAAEAYNSDDKNALFLDMKLYYMQKFEKDKKNIEQYSMGEVEYIEKEINSRKKYYENIIGFLNSLQEQKKQKNFLSGVINKGKTFVRTGRITSLHRNLTMSLANKNTYIEGER